MNPYGVYTIRYGKYIGNAGCEIHDEEEEREEEDTGDKVETCREGLGVLKRVKKRAREGEKTNNATLNKEKINQVKLNIALLEEFRGDPPFYAAEILPALASWFFTNTPYTKLWVCSLHNKRQMQRILGRLLGMEYVYDKKCNILGKTTHRYVVSKDDFCKKYL